MMAQDSHECIFCKIISRSIPSEVIAETEDVFVIADIHPKAPTHYLIMPKKHIVNVQDLKNCDGYYVAKMMLVARDLAEKLTGDKSFRLLMNNGAGSGQSVPHMHCHFLAGKKMADF